MLGQVVLVVLLARLLGAAGYGRFIVVLAVATFFAPLAGLGLQGVLLRDGSRHPDVIPNQLAEALWLWSWAVLCFSAIGFTVALLVLPHLPPAPAVAALVFGEVAGSSLVELLARIEQALDRIGHYGATMAGLVLARVAALGLYAVFYKPGVTGWMWAYAGASLLYAAARLVATWRRVRPHGRTRASPLFRQSIPFALGSLSLRLQHEFNKPVLAEVGYGIAGNFSLAQRGVDVAILPLTAFQEALWPRLYATSDGGRRMRFMGGFLFALALVGGGLLFGAAPFVPRLLGQGFGPAARLLRFLAALPALQVLRNFGNFRAVSIHRTDIVAWAYLVGALASVTLTLWLIPAYGWEGAVGALYLTEMSVIAVHVAFRLRPRRGER